MSSVPQRPAPLRHALELRGTRRRIASLPNRREQAVCRDAVMRNEAPTGAFSFSGSRRTVATAATATEPTASSIQRMPRMQGDAMHTDAYRNRDAKDACLYRQASLHPPSSIRMGVVVT
jgi:hypothetical protein